MTPKERAELMSIVEERRKFYDKWATRWSVLHQLSLYIPAVAGTITVLILKLDFVKEVQFKIDLSAILAGLVTVVTIIAAQGGFEKKLRVNRADRSSLDQLKIDLSDPNIKIDDLRTRLKEILRKHDEGIQDAAE
ncbi:MAG TPA: hypothetical protein VN843_27410 [Anaerolineales bacterium]|nr:hypothetical protein [Anaerolineales bacterium]